MICYSFSFINLTCPIIARRNPCFLSFCVFHQSLFSLWNKVSDWSTELASAWIPAGQKRNPAGPGPLSNSQQRRFLPPAGLCKNTPPETGKNPPPQHQLQLCFCVFRGSWCQSAAAASAAWTEWNWSSTTTTSWRRLVWPAAAGRPAQVSWHRSKRRRELSL